ncbi:hypothetical protein BDA99DRAFT_531315 [Phascolomyces articulosus]|uniref:Uncharacterized protein n=1 Tax=Phascolomyces articulosus TaxID=60185 RepID=A0AAD5KZL6_9FUNG|nr:hypothetical protein BDA99DRAFT_531315 [Phascolomyces articulosus]
MVVAFPEKKLLVYRWFCENAPEPDITTLKLADTINKINNFTQNNYSSFFTLQKTRSHTVFIHLPLLAHYQPINLPSMMKMHYVYTNITTQAQVPQGVDGCLEIGVEYARNMNDQPTNHSFNKVKTAMCFLAGALELPISKLLDYAWSYSCDSDTPSDDYFTIQLIKYVLTDFHANC